MSDIVMVVWLDAFSHQDEITKEKAKLLQPLKTFSVGHLVAQNEHGVTIATDGYHETPDDFRTYVFIPQGMVLEIVALTIGVAQTTE